jgi:hypothetical protein
MSSSLVWDFSPPPELTAEQASVWSYFVTHSPGEYIVNGEFSSGLEPAFLDLFGPKAVMLAKRFRKVPENIDPNFSYETITEDQWNLFDEEGNLVHTGSDWWLMEPSVIGSSLWQGTLTPSGGGYVPEVPKVTIEPLITQTIQQRQASNVALPYSPLPYEPIIIDDGGILIPVGGDVSTPSPVPRAGLPAPAAESSALPLGLIVAALYFL